MSPNWTSEEEVRVGRTQMSKNELGRVEPNENLSIRFLIYQVFFSRGHLGNPSEVNTIVARLANTSTIKPKDPAIEAPALVASSVLSTFEAKAEVHFVTFSAAIRPQSEHR